MLFVYQLRLSPTRPVINQGLTQSYLLPISTLNEFQGSLGNQLRPLSLRIRLSWVEITCSHRQQLRVMASTGTPSSFAAMASSKVPLLLMIPPFLSIASALITKKRAFLKALAPYSKLISFYFFAFCTTRLILYPLRVAISFSLVRKESTNTISGSLVPSMGLLANLVARVQLVLSSAQRMSSLSSPMLSSSIFFTQFCIFSCVSSLLTRLMSVLYIEIDSKNDLSP